MLSVVVVPAEPVLQVVRKLGSGFVSLQLDALIFQGAPESLDEDVVLERTLAVQSRGRSGRIAPRDRQAQG